MAKPSEETQNSVDISISDSSEKIVPAEKTSVGETQLTDDKTEKTNKFKEFVRSHHTRIIIILGILILIPIAVWSYLEFTKPVESVSKDVNVQKKAPEPTTKASPLTGVEVEPEQADKPILGVIIENHPDARPQSGLSSAGVVYEALAEGGITRFLAFFLEDKPASIGPVRSVRPYFVSWVMEFNSPIAHVGGNADALDMIAANKLKDINQFYNGASFTRTRDRVAPHNAYTSAEQMEALLKKNGYDKPAEFKPSPRVKKEQGLNPPPHPVINIDYSYSNFAVQYKYDATCNCYLRFMAGQPHIDRNTGQQIKVKNVVVEYMPTSYGRSRAGEQMVIMGTPGSGNALVFRDGTAIAGTWSKPSHTERTTLTDAAGKEIPLNKGNTWYSIVPTTKTVSY